MSKLILIRKIYQNQAPSISSVSQPSLRCVLDVQTPARTLSVLIRFFSSRIVSEEPLVDLPGSFSRKIAVYSNANNDDHNKSSDRAHHGYVLHYFLADGGNTGNMRQKYNNHQHCQPDGQIFFEHSET